MRTKMDVLGMKKLVLKLPKMFTSSVYNTPTKTGVLEVRNMRIVFHARKPTSKERKKEKERDVVVIVYFFVSVIILPVPSFFDDALFASRECVRLHFACSAARMSATYRPASFCLVSSLIFWPLESCIFCDKKGTL